MIPDASEDADLVPKWGASDPVRIRITSPDIAGWKASVVINDEPRLDVEQIVLVINPRRAIRALIWCTGQELCGDLLEGDELSVDVGAVAYEREGNNGPLFDHEDPG